MRLNIEGNVVWIYLCSSGVVVYIYTYSSKFESKHMFVPNVIKLLQDVSEI